MQNWKSCFFLQRQRVVQWLQSSWSVTCQIIFVISIALARAEQLLVCFWWDLSAFLGHLICGSYNQWPINLIFDLRGNLAAISAGEVADGSVSINC